MSYTSLEILNLRPTQSQISSEAHFLFSLPSITMSLQEILAPIFSPATIDVNFIISKSNIQFIYFKSRNDPQTIKVDISSKQLTESYPEIFKPTPTDFVSLSWRRLMYYGLHNYAYFSFSVYAYSRKVDDNLQYIVNLVCLYQKIGTPISSTVLTELSDDPLKVFLLLDQKINNLIITPSSCPF